MVVTLSRQSRTRVLQAPTDARSVLLILSAFWLLHCANLPDMVILTAFAQDDTATAGTVRAAAPSWPRFLNQNADGVASDVPNADWNAQPRLLWAHKVGPGYGIGTVDTEGNYYHFDASPSTAAERLSCLDLDTGQVKWSQEQSLQYADMYGYEPGPRSSATIAGDQLFTMGVGGQLTCRNRADGEEIWTVDTSSRYGVIQNFFGVGCSPLVWEDLVIVMVGGSPEADQEIAPGRLDRVSPNASAVVAFDRKTGKERWKCGDDLASYSSPRTMEVGGETIVLLYARDHLLAVDPQAGKMLWKFRHRADILESVNGMVPIVDNGRVFISECYALGSVLLKANRNSADVIWQDPARVRRDQAMRVHWSTPAVVDGYLYGCSGRNAPDSDFRCVELATGKVQWTDGRRIRTSVTAVGDHLLVLEERGFLQVMKANPDKMEVIGEWNLQDAADGRPELSYPCWAAPIVVGDKVLLRGDEDVLCLQLKAKES